MTSPRPLSIRVPDAVLADIASRVRRFPHDRLHPVPCDWQLGPPPGYVSDLCAYWANMFDWRARERELNSLSQHIATVDGLDLHFIYESGSGRAPKPLLLLHGWPYSFASFSGFVDALAHPERYGGDAEDGFTVVVPSLPGFGFSGRPAKPIGPRAMTALVHRLMVEVLGLPGYLVHGGDWGGYMASLAGLDYPNEVGGVHTTYVALRDASAPLQTGKVAPGATAEEKAFVANEFALHQVEGAYGDIQATKPLALAAAMIDSPVGTAVWMIDKFHAWSDRRRTPFETLFPFDRLLTEVMLYVATGTVETAMWIYAASRTEGLATLLPGRRVEVPTAVAAFPDPVFPVPPPTMVARSHNLVRYTAIPRGGHFPFYETPELLIDDLRAFARQLR